MVDRVLTRILCAGFRLWCRTLRVHGKNRDAFLRDLPDSYILTLWHSRIFYIFYHYRRRSDICLLISPSKDGDLLAGVARLLGYSVIRGSSYKKPVSAARALIRVLRRGQRIIVVADGSRGPRHKAQAGSLQLAAITGAPIIPLAWNARNKIEFNSWDRFVLPLPFTRVTLNVGDPIQVPPGADDNVVQEKQAELETALNRLTSEGA
ncbi:MAG: lysophospholipid acyltransferase family protein [Nitrospinales bacterium]